MTNEEILQKLEEEIYPRGFSPHTQEEYIIRAKSFMRYADRPLSVPFLMATKSPTLRSVS